MLEPSTVAPDRDSFLLLLQRGDVQINIADVNSIVRDWRIHPCVVTAQQLHRNFRHAVSVKSHFYTIISLIFLVLCISSVSSDMQISMTHLNLEL